MWIIIYVLALLVHLCWLRYHYGCVIRMCVRSLLFALTNGVVISLNLGILNLSTTCLVIFFLNYLFS